LPDLSVPTDNLTDTLELLRHALIGGHNLIEGVGNLTGEPDVTSGHSDGEIANPHGLEGIEQFMLFGQGTGIDRRIGRGTI
jgi:hypothetical protein